MSEQTTVKSVCDTAVAKERVINLSVRSDAPENLVKIAAKRYPYGESFSSYYQQDENALYLISIMKTEGENFRKLSKRGKQAKDFIRDWLIHFTGDLTEDEMTVIEQYWLSETLRI